MVEVKREDRKNGSEILKKLGLTNMQIRIYLNLVNLQTATVSEISKTSKIARQDIYKILPDLEEWGIIEKIIDNPTKYRATSINDGIAILIAKKSKETSKLYDAAIKFGRNYQKENEIKFHNEINKSHFILIPKKNALTNKLQKSFTELKESLDAIIPGKDWPKVYYAFSDTWELLSYRGIKIRIITNETQNKTLLDENNVLKNSSNFQIKFLNQNIPVRAGLHDGKRLFVATNPFTKALDSPALLTNNPPIIKLFETYFNLLWTKKN